MARQSCGTTGEGIVAIIERDERYLLIQRPLNIRAGGYWCFVGGAIEPGETQDGALVREVREEVGLEVEPLEKVWECLSLNREWVLHCWQARPLNDRVMPDPREVAAYKWLTVREIAEHPMVMPSVIDYFRHCGDL